jgi:hypothetical protein
MTTEEITYKLRQRKLADRIARDPMRVAKLLTDTFNIIAAMRAADLDYVMSNVFGDDEKAFGSFSSLAKDDGEYITWPDLEFARQELANFLDNVTPSTTL